RSAAGTIRPPQILDRGGIEGVLVGDVPRGRPTLDFWGIARRCGTARGHSAPTCRLRPRSSRGLPTRQVLIETAFKLVSSVSVGPLLPSGAGTDFAEKQGRFAVEAH